MIYVCMYFCVPVHIFLWSCDAEKITLIGKDYIATLETPPLQSCDVHKVLCVENWGFLDFKNIWKHYLVNIFH